MAKDQIDDIPGMDNIEEKDLDQYGVWVNTEGSETDLSGDDSDLLDIEEDFSSDKMSDDLGDLNDLLLSIDEENDQDDTIYLEEDVMSLDLDEDSEDMVIENTDSGSSTFDMDENIEIPSLDGEEISISLDDDDLKIPDLDTDDSFESNFDALDAELDSLSLDESIVDGLPPPGSEDDSISFDSDALPEESLDDLDLNSLDDSDDFGDISFDEDNALQENDSIELDLPEPPLDDIEESSDLALEGSSDLSLEHSDPIQSFHDDNSEDSFTIEEIESQSMPGSAVEKSYVTDSGLRQSNESLPELELDEDLALDDDLSISLEQEETFDDISAVTNEFFDDSSEQIESSEEISMKIESQETEAMTAPQEPTRSEDSGASSVLLSIEKELHAIRNELTDLRTELKKIRSKEPAPEVIDTIEEEPVVVATPNLEEEDTGAKVKGFFEDDEDETIALTGDELDNILNSAEFTEEAGEPSVVEEDDFTAISDGSDEESETVSQPFEDLTNTDLPPIEEISLEEMNSDDSEITIDDEHGYDGEMTDDNDYFQGSQNEVETMANLDIEKELAGIEDLSDGESDMELYTNDELDSIEIEIPLEDNNSFDEVVEPASIHEMELEEEIKDSDTVEPNQTSAPPLTNDMPYNIKQEIKAVLQYMDQLLDALPQEKIADFAKSEHFETYKKLFEELGI